MVRRLWVLEGCELLLYATGLSTVTFKLLSSIHVRWDERRSEHGDVSMLAPSARVCYCGCCVRTALSGQVVRLLTGLRMSWISATVLRHCTHPTATVTPVTAVTDERAWAASSSTGGE